MKPPLASVFLAGTRMAFLLLLASTLRAADPAATAVSPSDMSEGATPAFPPSPVISGVEFHDETARTLAPGSDIWPLTWAEDGHQYTTFGDGGGFGGTDHDGRVSLGIARVEGGKDDYAGLNIAGGKNAPHPAPFTGKSEGILALGDTLYLWRNGEGSDTKAFEFVRLYRSDDHGATWEDLGVEFSRRNGDFAAADEGFFGAAFCQFGQGYRGARDGFVYIYAPEIVDRTHWNIQKPGRIALMRVEKDRLGDKPAYRFFAGLDAGGQPAWTPDISLRRPVWQDAENGTHRIAASYNAPLRRYLLSTMTVDRLGQIAVYDAPEPWGPWTTVLLQRDTSRWGSKVITLTFANKWLSADGRNFMLVHTKNDSWASIEGEFILAPQPPATAPYPPSPLVERVEFDWGTHRREAPGSDNWPVTCADDGHQYTAWGDGGGFGGDNQRGRVTLGVARIEGDAGNYTGKNVWGGFEAEHPAQFGGKSYGILSIGGTLHMWVVPQPGPHLKECRLATSTDHGATWDRADWAFRFEDGLSIPTLLNFGRDYAGARDAYAYTYFIEPQWGPLTPKDSRYGFEIHRPGRIHLSRAPKDELLERDAHEFFAGLDAAGDPRWSRRVADKRPVFTDENGVGWNVSVNYNTGLGRYLLATEHGETHAGHFGLFDAPEPWGPWTTAAYEDSWGEGHIETSAFFWNFPTKWLSADGTRFTMVFTGKNSNDSWNTVAGRFVRRSPETPRQVSQPPEQLK